MDRWMEHNHNISQLGATPNKTLGCAMCIHVLSVFSTPGVFTHSMKVGWSDLAAWKEIVRTWTIPAVSQFSTVLCVLFRSRLWLDFNVGLSKYWAPVVDNQTTLSLSYAKEEEKWGHTGHTTGQILPNRIVRTKRSFTWSKPNFREANQISSSSSRLWPCIPLMGNRCCSCWSLKWKEKNTGWWFWCRFG